MILWVRLGKPQKFSHCEFIRTCLTEDPFRGSCLTAWFLFVIAVNLCVRYISSEPEIEWLSKR